MSPSILEEAFRRVEFDRDLVYKFFITFSLFEKALKEFGFRHVHTNEDIQPDWASFATKINEKFTSTRKSPDHQELETAVEYLLKKPPKKQVFRGGLIQFVECGRSDESDTVWLSVLIRRVRNNLFHGAKFSYDRPRDSLLLQYSLTILEAWANSYPDIQKFFQTVQ